MSTPMDGEANNQALAGQELKNASGPGHEPVGQRPADRVEDVSEFEGDGATGANRAYGNSAGNHGVILKQQGR